MTALEIGTVVEVETPGGNLARYICRHETNDGDVVRAAVGGDEYRLAGRRLDGLAIDVGAHIGAVSVALALDYPDLTVVALEPVPENFAVLSENLLLNAVYGRVVPLGRAAGLQGFAMVRYGFDGSHRYIGNEQDGPAEVVGDVRAESLSSLLRGFGRDEVAFLKIDCEGCEWAFLSDPAVGSVREIAGEVHRGDGPDEFARIEALLEETHVVEVDRDRYLFQAVRR